MKKFYSCMFAMGIAMAANAQLYVVGNENGWDLENPLVVEEVDGSYTFNASDEFKMTRSGCSDWDEFNSGVLFPATALPMEQTFSVDLMEFANAQLYLTGNDFGWEPSEAVEVALENGVYSFQVENPFKMSTTKSTVAADWNPFNAGALFPAETLPESFTEFSCGLVNGDANVTLPRGKWNVEVTSDYKNVTFTLLEAPEGFVDLYLRGDMNGWEASEEWQFTTTDGETYVLSGITVDSKDTFKIADDNWGTYNFGGSGEPIALNIPYELFNGGNTNLELEETGENLTFTFVLSTRTLTVSGEGGDTPVDPDPVDPDPVEGFDGWYLNVLGNFNSWLFDGVAVPEDGIVTATGVAIGTSEFKIKIWDGVADNWFSTGGAIATGEWVKIAGNNDANMTVEGATESSVYTVTWNCNNNSVLIEEEHSTGVAAIEAAEGEATYFNLQGARVENPAAGIYVKVLNGKATKVVVK